MANNHSIQAHQLREGQIITIRGKTGFSRLTRRIEGEELQAAIARQKQARIIYPTTTPYTTATIVGAEVIFADPSTPTPEEQYVHERRFTSRKKPETGLNYSIDSKGNNLPIIAVPAEDGSGTFVEDKSSRELAADVDVTLVLEVYKAKDQENRGLGLTHVIVNETPRYYTGGGVDKADLAARGITLAGNPQPRPAAGAQTTGESAPLEADGAASGGELPFPQPQAAGQVQAAPVQPAAQAAPVAQSAPAPAEQTPVQPAAPGQETPEQKLIRLQAEVDQLQGAPAQNAGSAVGAPTQAGPWDQQAQPGITYNQG